jgi:hypothetical protein
MLDDHSASWMHHLGVFTDLCGLSLMTKPIEIKSKPLSCIRQAGRNRTGAFEVLINEIGRINPNLRNAIAFSCFAAACVIGSLTYPTTWFWFLPTTQNFLPGLMSGIVALLLLLPVIRGDFLHSHRLDVPTCANLLFVFYLTSVFATMGIQGAGAISQVAQGPTFIITLLVITMANLNVRRYGELGILALVVFGGWNVYATSTVMGFWGWLFLAFSTVGIICLIDIRKVIGRFRRAE